MAYEYINKFKDDFEGITTIEMKTPIMYYIKEAEVTYQIKLVRVFGDDTDSLYLHINEGESCTSITNMILRINDSENIPLQLIKSYNTGVKKDNQYQFAIPFEKFRDICQANKIIFKLKNETIGDCILGNFKGDMLLYHCRIFYNQVYDSNEFPNLISEYDRVINATASELVSGVISRSKYGLGDIIQEDGQIKTDNVRRLMKEYTVLYKGGLDANRIFDEIIAIVEKKRWLRRYSVLPTFSQHATDKAFILLVADTVCAVERELCESQKWVIKDIGEPAITAEPQLRFEVPYLVTKPDKSLLMRYNVGFRQTPLKEGRYGISIYVDIFEIVWDGESVTHSVQENNPILKDEIKQLAIDFVKTYSNKIDWLFKKNLNYYENLSRPLSDDSIYDGTLFDVLPSLNVRVGGQEKVEEELVPAQPQPTKQSMKQPTKQLNHDAANHQNHPKHHSEDEKKTKIWPIILWIIAILLWLFF